MSCKSLKLEFTTQNNLFYIQADRPGGENLDLQFGCRFVKGLFVERGVLQVFAKLHPIFLEDLPCERIDFVIDENISEDSATKSVIDKICRTILRTNEILHQISDKRNIAKSFDGLWIYSPWIVTLDQIKERVSKEIVPERFFCDWFELGFDVNTRQWDISKNKVHPVNDFLRILEERKINRIVTANTYLAEHYYCYDIFILSILKYLGVDLTFIDFDLHELNSYVWKSAFSCKEMSRFTYMRHIEKPWDDILDIKVKGYIPSAFPRIERDALRSLRADYGVAVISNSRIRETIVFLDSISSVMEVCKPENLFDDFQMWYHAMRYLILKSPNLDLFLRDSLNTRAYEIYINGITFLKYEIIENLEKANRPVKLYGDNGWSYIFPDLYQNKLISWDEQKALFNEDRWIYLLMNHHYSYFESNPVFQHALEFQIPYLGFPAVVKTAPLKPLEAAEYFSIADLMTKIEKANEFVHDPEFIKARQYCLDINNQVVQALCNDFVGEKSKTGFDVFHKISEAHDELLEKRVQDYICENGELIRVHFEELLLKRKPVISAEESRFIDRSYMRTLLSIRASIDRESTSVTFA